MTTKEAIALASEAELRTALELISLQNPAVVMQALSQAAHGARVRRVLRGAVVPVHDETPPSAGSPG